MKIQRKFTRAGAEAETLLLYAVTRLGMAEDGEDAGAQIEVPAAWGQLAAEALAPALAQSGVPLRLKRLQEKGVPEFLWRSVPDNDALAALPADERFGSEHSSRQVFERYAGALTYLGWQQGYFGSDESARSFYDELRYVMATQIAVPPLADLARIGLDWAYGIEAPTAAPEEAARPLVLADIDLPGAEAVAGHRLRQEHKIAAMVVGAKHLRQRLTALREAALSGDTAATARALAAARQDHVPEAMLARSLEAARLGLAAPDLPLYDVDFDSDIFCGLMRETPRTALRLSAAFFEQIERQPAPPEWHRLLETLWASGAPDLCFAEAQAGWQAEGDGVGHGPATVLGRMRLNLAAFAADPDAGVLLDAEMMQHVVRLAVIAADLAAISAGLGQSGNLGRPDPARPVQLSLEPTNIAALVMQLGLAYDSAPARALLGAAQAVITATAYLASAELAEILGPKHLPPGLKRVLGNFRHAAYGNQAGYAGLAQPPQPLSRETAPQPGLVDLARSLWDRVLKAAQGSGLRHSDLCGISLSPEEDRLLGALAFDLAPLPALWRDLPQPGGYQRALAPPVEAALTRLGYRTKARTAMISHILGTGSFGTAPEINHTTLIGHGFGRAEIARLEAALPQAGHIRHVFTRWHLGDRFCREVLGIPAQVLAQPGFDLLAHLGFTQGQIEAASRHVLGAGHMRGAPGLKPAHIAVFDCAWPAVDGAGSAVSAKAVLQMLAALSSFTAGPIERPVTLPETTTPDQIGDLVLLAHQLGLPGVTLRREGAGLTAPQRAELLAHETSGAEIVGQAQPMVSAEGSAGAAPRLKVTAEHDRAGKLRALSCTLANKGAGRAPQPDLEDLTAALGRLVALGLTHGAPPEAIVAALSGTPEPANTAPAQREGSSLPAELAAEMSRLIDSPPNRAARPRRV